MILAHVQEVNLKVEIIDAYIRYWTSKTHAAKTSRDLWIARSHVDALQTVRLMHGLPVLETRDMPWGSVDGG